MSSLKTKDLDYYLALPYTIAMTPDEDGVWFAEIPLLKGCITQGENWNDALEMINEAKRAWIETALAHGIPIPEPEVVND
jgi:antitoxin HicB